MYLKKIEMIGFKSFVDRSEFLFDTGVTGIVGPNGCGKSNVVDAFKWIFGEQSAKGLRGSEMKDVIFNGSQARKASGYAEVTATFDNSDRFFDVDFNEIAITRQLFRSGESKYCINRAECRLRDIKEMLMGTGIGPHSYSIFEQGKIDVFLQASPQDRRIILEEAAGISKYRSRKAESLRALQRVEENLGRLGDVIAELERRRHRVKIQAGKARHYREYSDRLRELRVRLAIEDYRSSVTERADLTYQIFYLDFEIAKLDRTLRRLRGGLEEYSGKRRQMEETLAELRERMTEVRTRRERNEESIHHNQRRLEELGTELGRRRNDLEETANGLETECERLRVEEEGQARLLVELEDCRKALKERQETLNSLRESHESLRSDIEDKKRRTVEFIEEKSRVNNSVTQIDSDLGNLESRRERLVTEIDAFQIEHTEARSQATELESELERHRQAAAGIDSSRAEVQADIGELEKSLEATGGRLKTLHGELQGCQSRLDVLQSFEENLEGITQGVVDILKGQTERPGVHDMLAHLVNVEGEYAAAVDAILSNRAQALVVESEEGALELIREVRASNSGAFEVLPLERASTVERSLIEGVPGVVGLLRDFVGGPEEYAELFDKVFSDIVLIEDFDTAVRLSRNGLGRKVLVTLAGEIIDPCGSFSIPGELTMGLVSRRSEMQSLEKQIVQLESDVQLQEQSYDEVQRRLRAREEALEDLNGQRDDVLRQLTSVESRLEQIRKEEARLLRVVEVTQSEVADIDAENARARREKEGFEVRIEELSAVLSSLAQETNDLEDRLKSHGEEVHRAAEIVTQSRVALAECNKRQEGFANSIAQLQRAVDERQSRHAGLEGQISELEERLASTHVEIEQAESSLESVREKETSCQEELSSQEVEDRKLAEIEEAFRQEIDRLRSDQSEKSTERERVNLRDREGVLRRNSTLEKINDEYGLDLVEIMDRLGREENAAVDLEAEEIAEGEEVESTEESANAGASAQPSTGENRESVETSQSAPTEGGAPQTEEGAGEEAATADVVLAAPGTNVEELEESIREWMQGGDDWDRAAATEEAKFLQGKLRRLGNVNMDALEELEEIEERLGFQKSQVDDLSKAQRDLEQIISEINKTSREFFSKTFDEVQKNFRHLFEKCFGGGRADLLLEEGVDILEAGVEIVARPPGKKLTSLLLMSGGEKTMTTIALMFAIFRARPSPFCILDEVDAPLDEGNVRRFVVLLKEFVDNSQFIIITHNKITMAETDRLYGVTMQEKGVSKRVAVEFESYDPEDPEASMSTADIDEAPVV